MIPLQYVLLAAAVGLAACGRQEQQQEQPREQYGSTAPLDEEFDDGLELEELPDVDPELLGAPNNAFTAIEPSEVGVFGAPSVMEALEPLFGPEISESGSVRLTVRETRDTAVADIVRSGLADDSVAAGHVRIEFRREEDGWYPTNAYRRAQCGRGALAGQWTTELCP